MLAVQKQDPQNQGSIVNTTITATSGFGRVLGSIQGLQQRLGDFSYSEISIAEGNVKALVKRLTEMRDNLSSIAELKKAVIDINQHIDNLPDEDFAAVGLDSLEKHPKLHAIVQSSKLIRSKRFVSAASPSVDQVNLDSQTKEGRVTALAGKGVTAESKAAAAKPRETKNLSEVRRPAQDAAPIVTADQSPTPTRTAAKDSHQVLPSEQYPSSRGAPSMEIPSAEIDLADAAASDWTFESNEGSATLAEASSASVNFEFPDKTPSHQEVTQPNQSPTPPLRPGVRSTNETVSPARATADAPGTKRFVEKDLPVSAPHAYQPAKLDESRALVPSGYDFDQRLLDDLIKNYGDFATTPNLPATVEPPKKANPVVQKPATQPAHDFAKPAAAERDIPKIQKANDLDRQLKKIIKDYGEYDLYPKQRVFNLRTGGIAAFAVLGLVLGALYLFKAGSPAQTRRAAEPREPTRASSSAPLKPDKSAGVKQRPAGPETESKDTSPSTDIEQKP